MSLEGYKTDGPRHWLLIAAIAVACAGSRAWAANDVPVPASCTLDVNQKLAQLLRARQRNPVDNVMLCGTSTGPSQTESGGEHGDHQIIPVRVQLPDGSTRSIEVVTDDDLDGKVTAPANAAIFAYGQAFFTSTGRYAAGVHEVHCWTHTGADNGWVVVNGTKYPAVSCN